MKLFINISIILTKIKQCMFDLILSCALEYKVLQTDMPKILFIFSDMQFNDAVEQDYDTIFELSKQNFNDAGYEFLQIVLR